MRTHELKTWPEPFEAIQRGDKLFEFRRDDRGFAVGDVLVLRKWDPTPAPEYAKEILGISHTGFLTETNERASSTNGPVAELRMRVTYILRGFGAPDGFVVMGIQPDAGGER